MTCFSVDKYYKRFVLIFWSIYYYYTHFSAKAFVKSPSSASSRSSSSNESLLGGRKNQMRRKISKEVGRTVASTVPELVKILGGTHIIERVCFFICI